MASQTLKQDDLYPSFAVTLKNFGTLAGATLVFYMKHAVTGALKINGRPVIVTDANAGSVEYRWQTGDTDTPGTYLAEILCTYSDGKPQRFPQRGYFYVVVEPKLE
jgi:hypothetical protein